MAGRADPDLSPADRAGARYPSYLDFFAGSAMAHFRHSARVGGRLPVRLLKVQQDAHEDEDPEVDELLLGLVLGGAAPARWRWGGGGAWRTSKARLPGEIGVSPYKASGLFQVDGPSQMLVIGLAVERLKQALGEDVSLDFGRLHDRYAHSPSATRLGIEIWRAAGLPGPVSDDRIDAAIADMIEVLRALGGDQEKPAVAPSLSSRQMAKVKAAIVTSGASQLSVQDMATAVDLPVKTFRAAFRKSFGTRPHAYLLEHRIRLGMHWLGDRERRLADIALDLGFASQSHFTMSFSRQTGVPPLQYRRLLSE